MTFKNGTDSPYAPLQHIWAFGTSNVKNLAQNVPLDVEQQIVQGDDAFGGLLATLSREVGSGLCVFPNTNM